MFTKFNHSRRRKAKRCRCTMGVPSSKLSGSETVTLCKERTRFIEQAINSRYALSAAHLSYIQSLQSVGTALKRFVEAEISIDSLSTLEPDRTPSRSSYASSSLPDIGEHLGSPFSRSPSVPQLSNLSYMRASRNNAITVTINPRAVSFVQKEEVGSSWDYFSPNDKNQNFPAKSLANSAELAPLVEENLEKSCRGEGEAKFGINRPLEDLIGIASGELHRSNTNKSELDEELFTEREDASEFITRRAKDFQSSMKDIEYRFLKAAESGNEVSKLLETSKIRLNITTGIIGKSPSCRFLSTVHEVCCKAESLFKHESEHTMGKVITWNRSTSSLSSLSKIPFGSALNNNIAERECNFSEEISMISGSHSSTLDRLYAWERKLYDEVKGIESVRKAYDQKCGQLRQQFARNFHVQVIDKNRAVAKDLHSQMRVAIQSVDLISKKIEKIRDDELHPQLAELMQGLIMMWKGMLECHHTQFIIISLAFHVMSSKPEVHGDSNQFLSSLQIEIGCFASSFVNLVKAHKGYLEALNLWINKCILQPQERSKARRKMVFASRQGLILPPIFNLCQHWLKGIESLPSEELHDSIKGIASVLRDLLNQQMEDRRNKLEDDETEKLHRGWRLDGLQTGLARLFDRLTKFFEASIKAFEEVSRANETVSIDYYARQR